MIVTLWTLLFLSMLVASFAFDAHIETRITSFYRKRSQAEHLAKSGLPLATMLIAKKKAINPDDDGPPPDDDRWYEAARTLAKGDAVEVVEALGNGTVTVRIVTEQARRNINALGEHDVEKEENLERLLEVGKVPIDLWPTLVESFLDWTDDNDMARLDGAETEDYYAQLDPPYRAKNGPFDTVEELLLVKGFSRPILFGGEVTVREGETVRVSGIRDLLTTYGEAGGRINVNAASQRVLMTLPGVDDVIAGAIIEEREGWVNAEGRQDHEPFEGAEDLVRRIPELDLAAMKKYVTSSPAVFYRIACIGEVGNVKRGIWITARHDGQQMKVYRWREEEQGVLEDVGTDVPVWEHDEG